MASGARVQLSGFKELDEQLKRLSQSVARAALQRAGIKAMKPMAQLASQLAPFETHELEQSIGVGTVAKNDFDAIGGKEYSAVLKAGGSQAEAVSALRDARREVKGQRGAYYATVFMGPRAGRSKQEIIKGIVQEFGTLTREAHPYLRPAWEQDKGSMLERLKVDIWAEVNKSIARSEARKAARAAKG